MIMRLTRKWDWHSASVSLSPEVRDYAARVAVFSFFGNSYGERQHSAYLSRCSSVRCQGLWGSKKMLVSFELWTAPNPHPIAAHCPFPRVLFFIYVLLPGNSMSLSSNNRCWVRCCLKEAWTDKRFHIIWNHIVYHRLFNWQGRWIWAWGWVKSRLVRLLYHITTVWRDPLLP